MSGHRETAEEMAARTGLPIELLMARVTFTPDPAPSLAAEPPDGLREAIARELSEWETFTAEDGDVAIRQREWRTDEQVADALLAGPLAPLLDQAAKAEAAVARVRAECARLEDERSAGIDGDDYTDAAFRIREALDGAS